MISDVPRKELLRIGLPIAASYVNAFPRVHPYTPRLCLIGPTEEELREFCPNFLDFFENPTDLERQNTLLPVSNNPNLKSLLEAQWKWSDASCYAGITIIIVPAELCVFATLSHKQCLAPKEHLSDAHPGLVITLLCNHGRGAINGSLIVLPDTYLSATHAATALRFISQSYFAVLPTSSRETLRDISESKSHPELSILPEERTGPRGDPWVAKPLGFTPNFIWSLGPDESTNSAPTSLVAFVGVRQSYMGSNPQHDVVHLRRIAPHFAEAIASDVDRMTEFLQVVEGKKNRSEDDCFVPRAELMLSGHWSAANPDRELAGFQFLAQRLGYQLRRVDEICDEFSSCPILPNPTNIEAPEYLWFELGGPHIGRTHATAPPQENGDLVRLRCEDAWFLRCMLSDDLVQTELRCRAFGSLINPTVSVSLLKSIRVPWPSAENRRELRKRVAECHSRVENIQFAAEGLAREAEQLASKLSDGGSTSLVCSPERCWSWLVEEFTSLNDRIKETPLAQLEPGPDLPEVPPAPLAILERRMQHSLDLFERILVSQKYTEFFVRYDLALLCAALRSVDCKLVPKAFESCIRNDALKLAFGHCLELRRKALEVARDALRRKAVERPDVRGFLQGLVASDSKSLNKALDALIQGRNNLGHTTIPSAPGAEKKLDQIHGHFEEIKKARTFMYRHRLIYLESVRRTRETTALSVRLLTHAFADFGRDTIRVYREELRTELLDEEVYIIHAEPDFFLGLHPWIRFGCSDKVEEEVVWFIDGVDDDRVTYVSPQVADERLTITEGVEEVRGLIGLGAT